jgi:hypothetical protein
MLLSPWASPRGLAHPRTFSEVIRPIRQLGFLEEKMGRKSMKFSISPK